MSSITIEEDADFVITLIETDVEHLKSDNRKLTYLKLIGDHIDEMGEDILKENPKAFSDPKQIKQCNPIGENRSETEFSDILLKSKFSVLDLLVNPDPIIDTFIETLLEATRPPGVKGMNPNEFSKSGDCLRDDDAKAWLYKRKYTHDYDHIHVFPHDLCLLLDEDKRDIKWIEPDGIHSEGNVMDVLMDMFQEYLKREANA